MNSSRLMVWSPSTSKTSKSVQASRSVNPNCTKRRFDVLCFHWKRSVATISQGLDGTGACTMHRFLRIRHLVLLTCFTLRYDCFNLLIHSWPKEDVPCSSFTFFHAKMTLMYFLQHLFSSVSSSSTYLLSCFWPSSSNRWREDLHRLIKSSFLSDLFHSFFRYWYSVNYSVYKSFCLIIHLIIICAFICKICTRKCVCNDHFFTRLVRHPDLVLLQPY